MTTFKNAPHNAILASLSQDALDTLLSEMKFVRKLPGPAGELLPSPTDHCYFLETGLICHLAFADTHTIETSVVGCDGMFGFPALSGITSSPMAMMVQFEASGWSISAPRLHRAMTDAGIRSAILRFQHCLRVQLQQTAACNARHPVRERLLRWLLLSHDRVGAKNAMPVTQEALAMKLGARRQLVSEVVTDLADDGAVESGRGWITIADRSKALSLACGCYSVVANEYHRVLGFNGCVRH